ncbi:MAG TPA: ATP-binding protein [Lutibacter sp.]
MSKKSSLDSVDFYIQKMRDPALGDSICLNYANMALKLARKNTPNSKNIDEILIHKSSLFGNLKQLDSAIASSKELLRTSIAKNDSVAIGNNFSRLAYYYSVNFKKDSAFLFYNLSKEIHLNLDDKSKVGENLVQMAIIQSDFGDYYGSDETAIQALKYLDKNNIQYLTSVYNCIAISAKKQNDYSEAIYWYDKAFNISANEIEKIAIQNNMANAFRSLKDYDNSINLLTELITSPLLNEIPKTKARILDNLAYTKWLANENENVLDDLLSALTIRLKENDLYGLNASYAHLSDYYKQRNQKIALEYALKMYNIASRKKSPQDQLEALQKLIDLENSNKTKEYYIRYVKISDSLKDAEQNALNKFAKLKYDSKKNRDENLQLKIISAKKELELEKEKNRNIITGVSMSSIVIALLILGYYRKQKHKQEKLQEVYKTETRIAKKIHDEVANDVYNIMNKIQYTTNNPTQILDDLDKVYLHTRNISRENNTIETGINFEKYLKNMLSGFNNEHCKIFIKNLQEAKLHRIEKHKQITIYRVLQELMVNMQKHSKANLVVISFSDDKNYYTIKYSDNGIGHNGEELTLRNGLKNVENRIKAINGTVTFETTLNKGFKVSIIFKK